MMWHKGYYGKEWVQGKTMEKPKESESHEAEMRDLRRRIESMSHAYRDFATKDEGYWIRDQLKQPRFWNLGTGVTGIEGDFDIKTDAEEKAFLQDVKLADKLMRNIAKQRPNSNTAKFVKELDHINKELPALVRKTGKVYRSTSTDELLTLAHGGAIGDGGEKRDKDYGQEDNV